MYSLASSNIYTSVYIKRSQYRLVNKFYQTCHLASCQIWQPVKLNLKKKTHQGLGINSDRVNIQKLHSCWTWVSSSTESMVVSFDPCSVQVLFASYQEAAEKGPGYLPMWAATKIIIICTNGQATHVMVW